MLVSFWVAGCKEWKAGLLRGCVMLRPGSLFYEFDGPAEVENAGHLLHDKARAGEPRQRDVFLLDVATFTPPF